MNHHHVMRDVIIIGGGAAGLQAALMLGRARRHALVVDAGEPRNRFAEHMHGVLGHEGRPPADLVRLGRHEAAGYGIEFVDARATRVEADDTGVTVTLGDGRVERARALVVATGLRDELPEVPGLAERWGRTVLHCPYCHGHEFAGRRLGVLATGPMGLHQARLLRQWSDHVVLFSSAIDPLDPSETQRLRARGVEVVTEPVVELLGSGETLTGVRTGAGTVVELDALFTAARLVPLDGFLAGLGLERTEVAPLPGTFLAVDATGRTSHERIWAIGNVAAPMANVPMAMGQGALTGAFVNGWLVEQEFDQALAGEAEPQTVAEFWEARYADSDRVWSGRVNAVLAEVAAGLEPGRALDLGCGEGGDAIWLAEQGWQVTGVDLSPTAIGRAAGAALASGLDPTATTWQAADLASWTTEERFDLVSASFLQSWPVPIPRAEILRRAAGLVAPGGHLLVVAHAAPPPWADPALVHDHPFQSPEQDLADLALDDAEWQVVACEVRPRQVSAPDGTPAHLDDSVVLARRGADRSAQAER